MVASQQRADAAPPHSQRFRRAALPKIAARPRPRRAPRALEDVKIVLTTLDNVRLDNVRCQRHDHDRFRWSGGESGSGAVCRIRATDVVSAT